MVRRVQLARMVLPVPLVHPALVPPAPPVTLARLVPMERPSPARPEARVRLEQMELP